MPRNRKKSLARFSSWLPDHSGAIAQMTTKSAMSPLLWAVGVVVSFLLVAAYMLDGTSRDILIWLVVALVVFMMLSFAYFALFDPDRLQSEEFLVARQHVELLRENGKSPATIDLQANNSLNPQVQELEKVGQPHDL